MGTSIYPTSSGSPGGAPNDLLANVAGAIGPADSGHIVAASGGINADLFQTNNVASGSPHMLRGYNGGFNIGLDLQATAVLEVNNGTTGGPAVIALNPFTVATLPASPVKGWIAAVSDALAPAWGVTVTGGSSAYALVTYTGAAWTVVGK